MGLPLVALGQAAFAIYNLHLELLAPTKLHVTIPTLQIFAIRFLITYLGCVTWMRLSKIQHPFLGPPEVRGLLLARGVTGWFGVAFSIYHSLGYLTSDSTTLSFLTPCLTGFMGHLFLNEPFTPRELTSAFTSFAGVLFITKPHALFGGKDEDFLVSEKGQTLGAGWGIGEVKFAVGLGLLGVASASAAYTIIAAIGRRAHPLHVVAAFSGSSVVACIIGMVAFGIAPVISPTWRAFWLLLSSGVVAFCGQVLITMGLQGEKAGRGSLVLYLQIIFSGVVERMVLTHAGERISILSIIGSCIILGSAWFGTFNRPAPVLLSSPLPMPASSPKVFRSNSHQLRPVFARDRRDSITQKHNGHAHSVYSPSFGTTLLNAVRSAWSTGAQQLATTHPLSRPLATALPQRYSKHLSPPLMSPTGEGVPGLQLEIDGEKVDRPWRGAGAGAFGRKSPKPTVEKLDFGGAVDQDRAQPVVVL